MRRWGIWHKKIYFISALIIVSSFVLLISAQISWSLSEARADRALKLGCIMDQSALVITRNFKANGKYPAQNEWISLLNAETTSARCGLASDYLKEGPEALSSYVHSIGYIRETDRTAVLRLDSARDSNAIDGLPKLVIYLTDGNVNMNYSH